MAKNTETLEDLNKQIANEQAAYEKKKKEAEDAHKKKMARLKQKRDNFFEPRLKILINAFSKEDVKDSLVNFSEEKVREIARLMVNNLDNVADRADKLLKEKKTSKENSSDNASADQDAKTDGFDKNNRSQPAPAKIENVKIEPEPVKAPKSKKVESDQNPIKVPEPENSRNDGNSLQDIFRGSPNVIKSGGMNYIPQ